jgi:hypothetical protein
LYLYGPVAAGVSGDGAFLACSRTTLGRVWVSDFCVEQSPLSHTKLIVVPHKSQTPKRGLMVLHTGDRPRAGRQPHSTLFTVSRAAKRVSVVETARPNAPRRHCSPFLANRGIESTIRRTIRGVLTDITRLLVTTRTRDGDARVVLPARTRWSWSRITPQKLLRCPIFLWHPVPRRSYRLT